MPILNIMQQIYQSKHDGDYEIKPKEFGAKEKLFFQLLKSQLVGDLETKEINHHFTHKTGSLDISPLSKVYIVINEQGFSIINNQKAKIQKSELQVIKLDSLKTEKSYSDITNNLQSELVKKELMYKQTSDKHDIALSYPVLFYFMIFAFKKFLTTRQGKLAKQCHLPKIFQA